MSGTTGTIYKHRMRSEANGTHRYAMCLLRSVHPGLGAVLPGRHYTGSLPLLTIAGLPASTTQLQMSEWQPRKGGPALQAGLSPGLAAWPWAHHSPSLVWVSFSVKRDG